MKVVELGHPLRNLLTVAQTSHKGGIHKKMTDFGGFGPSTVCDIEV